MSAGQSARAGDGNDDLPPLPATDYRLFYEDEGDEDHGDEGYQEVLDEPGYTAKEMRDYARAALAAAPAVSISETAALAGLVGDVPAAMQTVVNAMRADPDYAWSWHCNIAMSFVDAGGDAYVGNQGAAGFMRLLAGVEPAHELPAAPAVSAPAALVPLETLAAWKSMVNTLAVLSLKRERTTVGITLKRLIQDEIDATVPAPATGPAAGDAA